MEAQERRRRVIERLKRQEGPLSQKEQEALDWVIGHPGVVEALLEAPITPAQEQECMEWAVRRDDQFALHILRYKKHMDALEKEI